MKQLVGSSTKKAHGAPKGGYSRFLLRVGFVLLMLGLIAFSVYQLVSHMTVGLDTLRTQEVTEASYVDLELFVFRDETVLPASGELYQYHVFDGERVGVGDMLATAYRADGDTDEVQDLLNLYARRLALAEQESSGVSRDQADTISKEIDRAYLSLLSAADDGRMGVASDAALRVQSGLRQYEAAVSNLTREEDQPAALRAAMAELLSGYTAARQINTDKSGYFYYDTDGYELMFDVDKLMTMTPEEFNALCDMPAQAYEGAVAGKMVYSSTWYAAAYVSHSDASESAFEVDGSYIMICDDSVGTEIPMTVIRMESTAEGMLIVFEANTMPEGFNFTRRMHVQTVTARVSGYRIPNEALVTLTSPAGVQVTGVYVLEGNVVEFRRIHITVSHEGYTVAATYEEVQAMLEALSEEERGKITADGWEYLGLNDKIITRGTGLYEGKMIS